ncbi:MAG: GMC family oxidoreductase, partial [Planctomycetota bacterium]
MIIDANKLDNPSKEISCSVCIIGSGAAGITLALKLSEAGIASVLLTGGSSNIRSRNQDLYKGTGDRNIDHEPLDVNRYRVFGGTTKKWGGRCVPFNPIDFEKRDFVPLSGWPVSYEDIIRYFEETCELTEAGQPNFEIDKIIPSSKEDFPLQIGESVIASFVERWSPRTDFAVRYRDELQKSIHLKVYLNCHCLDLKLDEGGPVKTVIAVNDGGKIIKFCPTVAVLAAGGLENARLLLAPRSQVENGIGNDSGYVGRCYMSHIMDTYGRVVFHSKRSYEAFRFYKDKRVYVRRRFALSRQEQLNKRILNVVGLLYRPDINDPKWGDPILSLFSLFKNYNELISHQKTLWQHVENVLRHPLGMYEAIKLVYLGFFPKNRLPYVLPYFNSNKGVFWYQGEHAPNYHSRVYLSDSERDR